MHIGKTAGSSLYYLLRESLPFLSTFHGSPDLFDRITAEELEIYGLITGHFSFEHIAKFRSERYLVTFLREPVNRVISSYGFLRGWQGLIDESNSRLVEAAKSMPLLEFLRCEEPQVRSVTSNHQTRTLACNWRDQNAATDQYQAEKALANLEKFDFIGLTEAYEDSVKRLFEDLGILVPDVLPAHNVTRTPIAKDKLSDDERELLVQLNTYDIQIYNEARRLFKPESDAGRL